MRTALRTSIVTAALAGVLLAPAATAFAASAAASSVSVSPIAANSSDTDRYDGESVLVADGRIAVLRNKSEGPEAWIRAVAPDWKPGDGWAGRVLAKLDTAHPRAVVEGVQYDLKKIDGGPDEGRYILNVYVLGEGALSGWYLLPKAEPATAPPAKPSAKPSTKPSAKPSAQPSAKPGAKPGAAASAAPTAEVKPQTVAVPKGPVAAGAELAARETADTTGAATAAVAAGLAALVLALGTGFMVRARKARSRG
ncbi:PT domain-containing protein [Streptomyces sp. 4.24]|uniref:PT domain-containing protein n=1 Tax=Streptomyces tritrimontium TaxID=3406573 RepID=UPI003BB53D56